METLRGAKTPNGQGVFEALRPFNWTGHNKLVDRLARLALIFEQVRYAARYPLRAID